MKRGLFRKAAAAVILAAAFCVIIPTSFAKMSDFAEASFAGITSGISAVHENGNRIHVSSDGDDIVITNSENEELCRLQDALPLLPTAERSLIESGFDLAEEELEKLLEAYTS